MTGCILIKWVFDLALLRRNQPFLQVNAIYDEIKFRCNNNNFNFNLVLISVKNAYSAEISHDLISSHVIIVNNITQMCSAPLHVNFHIYKLH